MKWYLIGLLFSTLWIAYEMYTAPMMDDDGRIIKEGKKLSDLFKKNLKNKQLWMSNLQTVSQRA